jgi:hypothetical protein
MSEIEAILHKRFQHIIEQENWNFAPPVLKGGGEGSRSGRNCKSTIAIIVFCASLFGIIYLTYKARCGP